LIMLDDRLTEHYTHVPVDAEAVRRIQQAVLTADPHRARRGHILVAAGGLLLVAALVVTVQLLRPTTNPTNATGQTLSAAPSATTPALASADRLPSTPPSSTTPNPAPSPSASLPPVVRGIPVARLARQALAAAKTWSVPHPTNVRVVATTWGQYESPRTQGAADPVYVVALTGHFACIPPTCSTSPPANEPSTTPARGTIPLASAAPGTIPLSYMIFTVAVRGSASPGTTLSVAYHDRNLARFGHVLNLQPYVDAIE
jgi:hypothetical protein